jgi:hypothetical protein
MNRKRQPPSRMKYAEENPTIGIHVTREERDRLRTLSKQSGHSVTQTVKQILGLMEKDVAAIREHSFREGFAEGEKTGFAKGRKLGFAEAAAIYRVTYSCSDCGGPIELQAGEADAKEAAASLTRSGWVCADCPDEPPTTNQ